MLKYLCTFILLIYSLSSDGQENGMQKIKDSAVKAEDSPRLGTTVYARIIDGDTIPIITLKEFSVTAPRSFASPKEAEKWDRLKRDVKKAYPFAKIAGQKLKEYNDALAEMKSEKDRKAFLKDKEKEMKAEFENDLKRLTLRQGKLLIKLIDRETGSTSYELVKELKGSFSVFMWQSLARMFGTNLKDTYDANGEDKAIEDIVKMIERGEI
jgi:hypothetical protein